MSNRNKYSSSYGGQASSGDPNYYGYPPNDTGSYPYQYPASSSAPRHEADDVAHLGQAFERVGIEDDPSQSQESGYPHSQYAPYPGGNYQYGDVPDNQSGTAGMMPSPYGDQGQQLYSMSPPQGHPSSSSRRAKAGDAGKSSKKHKEKEAKSSKKSSRKPDKHTPFQGQDPFYPGPSAIGGKAPATGDFDPDDQDLGHGSQEVEDRHYPSYPAADPRHGGDEAEGYTGSNYHYQTDAHPQGQASTSRTGDFADPVEEIGPGAAHYTPDPAAESAPYQQNPEEYPEPSHHPSREAGEWPQELDPGYSQTPSYDPNQGYRFEEDYIPAPDPGYAPHRKSRDTKSSTSRHPKKESRRDRSPSAHPTQAIPPEELAKIDGYHDGSYRESFDYAPESSTSQGGYYTQPTPSNDEFDRESTPKPGPSAMAPPPPEDTQVDNPPYDPYMDPRYGQAYSQDYPPGPSEDYEEAEGYVGGGAADAPDDELDSRYVVEHSSKFAAGEVFKILWPEPRGAGKTENFTEREERVHKGQLFFVGFRRFIVVANDEGHCTCVPILTYERRACTKRGVKPQKHGVVYPLGGKPHILSGEPELGFHPVRLESLYHSEKLAKESRVNYSKLVTVEHNARVLFIGRIWPDDMNIVHNAVDRCWEDKKRKTESAAQQRSYRDYGRRDHKDRRDHRDHRDHRGHRSQY